MAVHRNEQMSADAPYEKATSSASEGEAKQKQGAGYQNEEFSAEDRNAMRAFLARCEVRISTLHRVAVGFISGAGLLLLLPIFLKDGVLALIDSLLSYAPRLPATQGIADIIGLIVIYAGLLYPFALSLSLPGVALLLLLEDIVHFYFVGHMPGFSDELFSPRLILTGIAFSPDESEKVKSRVLRYQYGSDLISFVMSRADANSRYYSNIIDKPGRFIVPSTRKLPRLLKKGVIKLAKDRPLEQVAGDDKVYVQTDYSPENGGGNGQEPPLVRPQVERTVDDIDRFNAALGLTGFIERPLYQEVAKTEVSLTRHILKLRRMVLRYFQALLIFLWTSLVTFLMIPFLRDSAERFPLPLVFGVAYLIWAILAPVIVQLPINWLVSNPNNELRRAAVERFQQLDTLHTFGRRTQRFCYGAIVASLVVLILELTMKI
jgi:hypothetical protein